jgi:hypothetical protein
MATEWPVYLPEAKSLATALEIIDNTIDQDQRGVGFVSVQSDLEIIAEQERQLVFTQFDEDVAFAIGAHVREAGRALGKGIAVGVYLWDRTMFYGVTAGASAGNRGWVERKANTVRLQMKSTYRIVLERGDKPRLFEDSWALDPGTYVIKVQTNRLHKQVVTLRNGDYLIASLKEEPGKEGMHFERVLVAEDHRMRPNMDNQGWHLTDLQNQLKRDHSLEMLLTLENRADRSPERGGTLSQIRPRLAWFELRPQNSNERIAFRVGDCEGYAAPAWSLRVPYWPNRENATDPARPLVDVWWTRDFPEIFATPVRRAAGTDLASGFKGKVQVGAGATNTVTIEDVRVEERTVEAEPGTMRKVSCLVVRLSYPRGKPVQVLLDGIEAQGYEHRYYTQAGKYTALFWNVSDDTARKLKGLQLVSLEKLKSDDARTSHIELKIDEPPNAEGRPPSIPESLPR